MKILLVEDEQGIRNPLRIFFEHNGYVVDEAEDGASALDLINIHEYDCILLDINLPEISGLEISKKMREDGNHTPILMLTARTRMQNKLEGFEAGTDDYVTKPFDLHEVLARVKALINRKNRNFEDVFVVGKYIFSPKQCILKDGNKEIALSNKECAILEYLCKKEGITVSTEELIEHVWDSNVNEFTQTVKTHIKTLRQKFDSSKEILQTVKGRGYVLKKTSL